jgi:hypothetical protein
MAPPAPGAAWAPAESITPDKGINPVRSVTDDEWGILVLIPFDQ